MSDHVDGPRQIGDPAADLTDLFAFTSPRKPCPYSDRCECVSVGRGNRDVLQCGKSFARGAAE